MNDGVIRVSLSSAAGNLDEFRIIKLVDIIDSSMWLFFI